MVRLDDENHLSWANMGSVHLRAGRHDSAYHCFRSALRHKRSEWRLWENYVMAAYESARLDDAMAGLHELLGMYHKHKRLDVQTLALLVRDITGGGQGQVSRVLRRARSRSRLQHTCCSLRNHPLTTSPPLPPPPSSAVPCASSRVPQAPEDSWALMAPATRDARRERLAKLLARSTSVARTDYRLWDVCAVFREAIGEPQKALDCRLKQCRSLQGASSAWRTERKAFERVGKATLATAQLYLGIADEAAAAAVSAGAAGSGGGASAAAAKLRECRFFVEGVVNKASAEHVGETEMYATLGALLADVKAREKAGR